MKRTIDFILSAIMLALLSPLFILLVCLIKTKSNGPAFFKQQRVGLHGKPFNMLKFRSMVNNAEDIGPYFTSKDDQRITAVGKFLRLTSLDELPQLLNVFLGDMSFVGPRPDVLEQKSLYTEPEWRLRHTVLPGITGLAQASKRSQATVEDRKAMDLTYVETQSLILDVKILFMTVWALVARRLMVN